MSYSTSPKRRRSDYSAHTSGRSTHTRTFREHRSDRGRYRSRSRSPRHVRQHDDSVGKDVKSTVDVKEEVVHKIKYERDAKESTMRFMKKEMKLHKHNPREGWDPAVTSAEPSYDSAEEVSRVVVTRSSNDEVRREGRNEERTASPGSIQYNRTEAPPSPEKPNFEPSGLLLEETNLKNGVLLKYTEPPDARCPLSRWRIYVFKESDSEKESKILHLHRHSCFIVGKEPRVAEILLVHPTISKQHAAIQFRLGPNRQIIPYLIDLESTNGSFLNGERIEPCRYYELRHGDSLRFGRSTRDLVMTNEAEAHVEKVSYAEYVQREIDLTATNATA